MSPDSEQVTQRSRLEHARIVDSGAGGPSNSHVQFLGLGSQLVEGLPPLLIVLSFVDHQISEANAAIFPDAAIRDLPLVEELHQVGARKQQRSSTPRRGRLTNNLPLRELYGASALD